MLEKGMLADFKGRILWHASPLPHTLTLSNISVRTRLEKTHGVNDMTAQQSSQNYVRRDR